MRDLDLYPDEMIFQQGNARSHALNVTSNWLERHWIETLDWPAYSPNLNPIENLLALLVQRVYANGRCLILLKLKMLLYGDLLECIEDPQTIIEG